MESTKRKRTFYSEEFKRKIIALYKAGKSREELLKEYNIKGYIFNRWLDRINKTGSTREEDNRTDEQKELRRLQKEVERLKVENEILKQAALIFAQK